MQGGNVPPPGDHDHMTPTQLLHFEQHHPHHTPAKVAAIREQLRITEVRYYVLLERAARSAEGIVANPVTARMVRETAQRRALERERRIA